MATVNRKNWAEKQFTQCLARGDIDGAAKLLQDLSGSSRRFRAKALIKYLLTIGKTEEAYQYAVSYNHDISGIKPYKKLPAWLRRDLAEPH